MYNIYVCKIYFSIIQYSKNAVMIYNEVRMLQCFTVYDKNVELVLYSIKVKIIFAYHTPVHTPVHTAYLMDYRVALWTLSTGALLCVTHCLN